MCSNPSVCNMPPSQTSTPAILHALRHPSPAERYPVGPVTPPLFMGVLQLPAWLAFRVARPTPDWFLDAVLRVANHPMHSQASGSPSQRPMEPWWDRDAWGG